MAAYKSSRYNYKVGYSARIYSFSDAAYYKLFETLDAHENNYTISSGKVKCKLDGPSSATFTLPRTNPNAATIAVGDIIYIERGEYTPITLRNQDGEIFGGYVVNVERDIYGNAEVTANNYINCLSYWLYNTSAVYGYKTLAAGANAVINQLYKSLHTVCSFYMSVTDISCNITLPANEYTDYLNLWEICVSAANKVSTAGTYHYWYDNCRIWYPPVSSSDVVNMECRPESEMETSTQTVELGKNIKSITMEENMPDATIVRVSGQDADGNDLRFTGYNNNVNTLAADTISTLPWIEEHVDFGDGFESAATLKSTAQDYINRVGDASTSYQIEALDLYGTDSSISPFKIGQRVQVISTKHDLDVVLPITELDIDLLNPLNTTISAGGTRPRITAR